MKNPTSIIGSRVLVVVHNALPWFKVEAMVSNYEILTDSIQIVKSIKYIAFWIWWVFTSSAIGYYNFSLHKFLYKSIELFNY